MVSRSQSAGGPRATEADGLQSSASSTKTRWIAAGGIIGALAASSCCIVPLTLFSLGISGAWVGNLTALEPYKPIFIVATLGILGYGYWLVYPTPKTCADGTACEKSLPNHLVKSAFWASTVLILVALLWKWIAPIIAPLMLGL